MSKKIIGLIVAATATVAAMYVFFQVPVEKEQVVDLLKDSSRPVIERSAPVISESFPPKQNISQPTVIKRTHSLMKGLRLIGVSENVENQKKSYAMLEVDGKRYITVYLGKEVKPGVTLAEITSSYVMVRIEQQLYQLDFSNVAQPDNVQAPVTNVEQQPADYHQSTMQPRTPYSQSRSYSAQQPSAFRRQSTPVITSDDEKTENHEAQGDVFVGGGIGSQIIQLDSTSSQTTTGTSTTSSSSTTTEGSGTEEKRPDFMIDPGTISDEVPASVEGGDVAVPESDVPLFMIDPPPPGN